MYISMTRARSTLIHHTTKGSYFYLFSYYSYLVSLFLERESSLAWVSPAGFEYIFALVEQAKNGMGSDLI